MGRFLVICFFGILFVGASLSVALLPPFLDFKFYPRMTLESSAGTLTLDSLDLTGEPGEFVKFEDFHRFYERQETLFRIISESPVHVHQGASDVTVNPRSMGIMDLPFLFWVQIGVGLGTLLISGWIWCLRSRNLPGFLFFAGGLSVLVSGFPSAIYTTRELALPGTLFRVLEDLNALGAATFGIAIIALFMVHPVRLPHWKTLSVLQALFFGSWVGLFILKLVPEWANINLSIVLEMLVICVVIGIQFWLTRGNQEARASLTWLGVSMIFGGGAFVVFNTVPVILGTLPLDQGYSFIFFLIIYLGLAAGLTDFKLFQGGKWVFKILFYMTGLLSLVLLDAGFIFALKMNRWHALGLSLIVTLFIFFPLREVLWKYLRQKS